VTTPTSTIRILMADDDPDDCMLTRDAFAEAHLINDINFVSNGQELLDYLRHQGPYAPPNTASRPNLILLDLNMPVKNGREALQEIKADPELRSIPVIILTTSQAEEEILRAYDLGASSFITKPVLFESMIEIVKSLGEYWFEIVELPNKAA
jgi:two-component system, response regulator